MRNLPPGFKFVIHNGRPAIITPRINGGEYQNFLNNYSKEITEFKNSVPPLPKRGAPKKVSTIQTNKHKWSKGRKPTAINDYRLPVIKNITLMLTTAPGNSYPIYFKHSGFEFSVFKVINGKNAIEIRNGGEGVYQLSINCVKGEYSNYIKMLSSDYDKITYISQSDFANAFNKAKSTLNHYYNS